MSFISFSCLTALARASSTILKRIVTVGFCVKQKQWFLSQKKAFSFSPLSMMLAVGLSCTVFIVLYIFPVYPVHLMYQCVHVFLCWIVIVTPKGMVIPILNKQLIN